MITLHKLSEPKLGQIRKTLCGKLRFEVDYYCKPSQNLKTVLNSLRASGKEVEICIYCTRWIDLINLANTDL